MPIYEYKCPSCGTLDDVFCTITEYCANPPEPVCCVPMERVLSASTVIMDIPAYVSPVDGTIIKNRQQETQHMRQHRITKNEDYTEQWAKQASERERFQRGELNSKERRELRDDISTAIDVASSSGYVPPSKRQEHDNATTE